MYVRYTLIFNIFYFIFRIRTIDVYLRVSLTHLKMEKIYTSHRLVIIIICGGQMPNAKCQIYIDIYRLPSVLLFVEGKCQIYVDIYRLLSLILFVEGKCQIYIYISSSLILHARWISTAHWCLRHW